MAADIIRLVRITGRTDGMDSVASALDKVRSGFSQLDQAQQASERRVTSQTNVYTAFQRSLDPIGAAAARTAEKYASAVKTMAQGGKIAADQAQRDLKTIESALNEVGSLAERQQRQAEALVNRALAQQSARKAAADAELASIRQQRAAYIELARSQQEAENFRGTLESRFQFSRQPPSARASASVFEAEFKRQQDEQDVVERALQRRYAETARRQQEDQDRQDRTDTLRHQQNRSEFGRSFDERMGIGAAPATAGGATFSALAEQAAKEDAATKLAQKADANAIYAALKEQETEYQRLVGRRSEILQKADPVALAQERVKKSIADGNALRRAGLLTEEQLAKLLVSETATLERLGKAHQIAGYQVQNIRAQLVDIGSGLLTGQSPLTVGIQQLPQIAGAFAPGTGLLGMLRGVGSSVPRGALVGGGIGAIAAALAAAYTQSASEGVDERRSLRGVGLRSGLGQTDLERLTSGPNGLGVGDLSLRESRSVGLGLAGAGLGPEAITRGLEVARNMSVALNQSLEETGKVLADFGNDPVKSYDALAKATGYANANTRQYIVSLAEQGEGDKALIVTLDAITGRLGKYTENTTTIDRALTRLGNVGSNMWSLFKRDVDVATDASGKHGDTVKTASEKAIDALEREKKKVEERTAAYRERADALTLSLQTENQIARLNPLEQSIVTAQRGAGAGPAFNEQERKAREAESPAQRALRENLDLRIRREVTLRNDLDLQKSLTEQSRTSALTMQAEIAVVGQSAAAQDRARFAMQEFIKASAGGKTVSADLVAQIDKEAGAYAKLADNLRRVQLSDQIKFDRGQLGRDSQDQAIATQLRSSGLGKIDDPKNAGLVSDLRLNQQLSELKTDITGSISGVLTAIRGGADPRKALADQAGRLADQYLTRGVDKAVSGLFSQFGLDKLGLSSTSTTASMNVTAATVNLTGGLTTGSLGSAGQTVGAAAPGASSSLVPGVASGATSALTTASRGDVRVGFPIARPSSGDAPSLDKNNPDLPQSPLDPDRYNTREVANAPSIGSPIDLPVLTRPYPMGGDPMVDGARVVPDSALTGLPQGYFPPPGTDFVPSLLTPSGKFDGRLPGPTSLADPLDDANKSLANLDATAAKLPTSVDSAESSLGSFASSLFNFKPSENGSGFNIGSMFGLGGGGGTGGGEAVTAATGGYIRGPGTSTSDSIPARLSAGEYVMRASAVERFGVDFMHAVNAHRLPGLADGGPVGMPMSTPVSLNPPMMPVMNDNAPAPASAPSQPITINVQGAKGNSEIQDMVSAGVHQGIAAYDKNLYKALPGHLNTAKSRGYRVAFG